MQYSNRAYLLIGGNLGDRVAYLNQAKSLLSLRSGRISAVSGIYETAAWGITDQEAFLNQAILLETALNASELMQTLLHAENEIGRIRTEKYGPRIIDIDILLFNDEIIHQPDLKIPHPELANRRFALEPLNELAPSFIHPVLKKSIGELLKICPDTLPVALYENRPSKEA